MADRAPTPPSETPWVGDKLPRKRRASAHDCIGPPSHRAKRRDTGSPADPPSDGTCLLDELPNELIFAIAQRDPATWGALARAYPRFGRLSVGITNQRIMCSRYYTMYTERAVAPVPAHTTVHVSYTHMRGRRMYMHSFGAPARVMRWTRQRTVGLGVDARTVTVPHAGCIGAITISAVPEFVRHNSQTAVYRWEEWYAHGVRHRVGGPAIIGYDDAGVIIIRVWYQHGEMARTPASEPALEILSRGLPDQNSMPSSTYTPHVRVWPKGASDGDNAHARTYYYPSGNLRVEEWGALGTDYRGDLITANFRDGGPAVTAYQDRTYDDGTPVKQRESWIILTAYSHLKRHRLDGPAYTIYHGARGEDGAQLISREGWYVNGLLHRENGPASTVVVRLKEGEEVVRYEGWYVNGLASNPRGGNRPANVDCYTGEEDACATAWGLPKPVRAVEWAVNGDAYRADGPAVITATTATWVTKATYSKRRSGRTDLRSTRHRDNDEPAFVRLSDDKLRVNELEWRRDGDLWREGGKPTRMQRVRDTVDPRVRDHIKMFTQRTAGYGAKRVRTAAPAEAHPYFTYGPERFPEIVGNVLGTKEPDDE